MPIMSFSISEELKRMIQSLVEKKKAFKNQSGFVRTALTHYINSAEAKISVDEEVDAADYRVSGQVMLSFKKGENENKILKDIYSCEGKYPDNIASFQMVSADINTYSCIYTFLGNIFDFRKFVDDLDSVQNIEQLRYIISE
jgi:Arc/MetJ-type ribon-helix-helix transcriptional regulator